MRDPRHILRQRLRLTAVVLVVTLAATVLFGWRLIDAVDVQHQELAYGAAQDLDDVHALAMAQQERSANARGYLLSGDETFLEARRVAAQTFDARLANLQKRHANDPISADLARIAPLWQRLAVLSDRAMAEVPGDRAQAVSLWDHGVRPVQAALSVEAATLVATQRARFNEARSSSQQAAEHARRLLQALALAVVLVLGVLFYQLGQTAAEASELASREQEQTTFRLLDQVQVGVFVVEGNGKVYFANQRARSILGTAAEPATRLEQLSVAYAAYEAGTDRPYPIERTPLARALQGESSEITDMELRRGEDVVPLHVRGGPIYDSDGALRFAVAAFQDVRELHEAATRDPLTGLGNRSTLAQSFTRERMLQERSGTGLALAILDLDHFKQVNDVHGHLMGDTVLKRTASCLVQNLRRTDLVIRWGGEEFVAVLPNSDAAGARAALQKALAALSAEAFQTASRTTFHVTFSAGVVVTQTNESLQSAVARADALLYAAKRAGRNRVLIEGEATAG